MCMLECACVYMTACVCVQVACVRVCKCMRLSKTASVHASLPVKALAKVSECGGTHKYKCVDASMFACKCACLSVQGHVSVRCMCVHECVRVCMCMNMFVFTYENAHGCFHVRVPVCMHASVPMCQHEECKYMPVECKYVTVGMCERLRVCKRECMHVSVGVNDVCEYACVLVYIYNCMSVHFSLCVYVRVCGYVSPCS